MPVLQTNLTPTAFGGYTGGSSWQPDPDLLKQIEAQKSIAGLNYGTQLQLGKLGYANQLDLSKLQGLNAETLAKLQGANQLAQGRQQGEYGLAGQRLQGTQQLAQGRQQGDYGLANTRLVGANQLAGLRTQGQFGLENTRLQNAGQLAQGRQQGEYGLAGQRLQNAGSLANTTAQGTFGLENTRLQGANQLAQGRQQGEYGLQLGRQQGDFGLANTRLAGEQNLALGKQKGGYDVQQAQIAANAASLPAQLQQRRFDEMFPYLKGQLSNIAGQAGAAAGGPGPEITAGPVLDPQQIQQQVNAARAGNDAETQNRITQMQQGLSGRGFGAASPLAAALQAQYGYQNLATNAGNERDLRLDAAKANAQQMLSGQQARENQYASRQQESIERQKPKYALQSSLLAALAGLA